MMYRIGHFADVHHPSPATGTVVSDLDTLVNTKQSDIVVWGGDQVSGDEANVPHTPENQIRTFWTDIVEQVPNATEKSYTVPGNHDVPYQYWNKISREYIGDRVGTPQLIQPVDGLSIMLINTQGPAIVQGGSDSLAQDYCYVPYHELEWLDEKLAAANSRGDVKIVIGHAPVWFSWNPDTVSYHPDNGWSDKEFAFMTDDQAYEIPSNFQAVYDVMNSHGPVIYHSGHDFHGPGSPASAEFYRQIGDLYITWQDHYSIGPSTVAFCDVDTSTGNVQYKTFSSGGTSESTIMNVTPSW